MAKYSEVKLAVSKVQPLAPGTDGKTFSSEPKIQVVCIDDKTASDAGMNALQLGHDIMEDIQSHGKSFGITKAEMASSTGVTTSPQKGSLSASSITGIVLGVILLVSLLGLAYFLYRRDAFRLPMSRYFWFLRDASQLEEEPASVDASGFSNPIFDPTAEVEEVKPGLQIDSKEWSSVSAVQFSNPLFDNMEV